MKRLFDLALTVPAVILLVPVFLIIALAIVLDSGRPVFFRQVRVGRAGRPFPILKFRSMVTGADRRGPAVTATGDARITRIGAWLRRTKLDELPQLLNVFAGQMSLVGPRPEVPEYVAHYTAEQKRVVLSVRPGITDLASIEFRNESDMLAGAPDPVRYYVQVILPLKLGIYERYVRERSLWGDTKILGRTLLAVGLKRD